MLNYLSLKHRKGELHQDCKFNVSEQLAEMVLANLKKYFAIELAQGSVTRNHACRQAGNKRVVIEIKVSHPDAAIIKQAFLSQLQIFENQN